MGLFPSLDSIQEDCIESTPIGVSFNTVECMFDSFLSKIEDGTMNDTKIQSNIEFSYKTYLDYDHFKDPSTRPIFQKLWVNERFLKNFIEVLKSNPNIVSTLIDFYIISINTIGYDYYSTHKHEPEDQVMKYLFQICEIVNMKYILQLSSIVDVSTAAFITMANFSSFDKDTAITRLNLFIVKVGWSFTVKDIIYIYSRFFSTGFSMLFNNVMTNTMDGLESEQQRNYDNISLAILNILSSMTTSNITKILSQYGSYITLMQKGTSIRFSIRGLSADWARIVEVAEQLNEDCINIP